VTLENEFANLSTAEAIDLIAARYGDREALVFGDRRYSFSDIVRESSLASIRLHEMGIRAGDKISIWLPNCPEFLWCLLGAARIAVVLNTKLRSEEIAYQIDQSDSRCVVSTGRSTFRAFLDDIASLAPSACRRRPAADGSPAVERLAKLEFVVSIDECAAQHDRVIRWNEIPAGQDAPPLENDPNSPALIACFDPLHLAQGVRRGNDHGLVGRGQAVFVRSSIWNDGADHQRPA
jgi:fatty-acyl-CoA synthase